jgi:hypothetical protein
VALLGAVIQVLFVFTQKTAVAAHESNSIVKLMSSGVYSLMQVIGIGSYVMVGLLLRYVSALSILFMPVFIYFLIKYGKIWVAQRDRNKIWILFTGLFTTAVAAVIVYIGNKPDLGTVPFGAFHSRTWMIPITVMFFGWIFMLVDIYRDNCKKLQIYLFLAILFTGSFSVFPRLFTRVTPPAPGKIGFSDWKAFSGLVDTSPLSFCIPVNPYPWFIGFNCRALILPSVENASFEKETFNKPELISVEKLNLQEVQTIGFIYQRIETSKEPELEVFVDGTNEVPFATVRGLNSNYATKSLMFKIPEGVGKISGVKLKNVDKISHQNGEIQFVVFGK